MPKISALPPVNSPDDADVAPLNDTSATQTGKWTLAGLLAWLQTKTAWVTTAMLAAASVTSSKLSLSEQTGTLSGTTTSNTLVNVGTAKTITVPSTGRLLVSISGTLVDSANGSLFTVALSGANTVAGNADNVPAIANTAAAQTQAGAATMLITGLTPGSTTVQPQMRRFGGGSGTTTLLNGRLTVAAL